MAPYDRWNTWVPDDPDPDDPRTSDMRALDAEEEQADAARNRQAARDDIKNERGNRHES